MVNVFVFRYRGRLLGVHRYRQATFFRLHWLIHRPTFRLFFFCRFVGWVHHLNFLHHRTFARRRRLTASRQAGLVGRAFGTRPTERRTRRRFQIERFHTKTNGAGVTTRNRFGAATSNVAIRVHGNWLKCISRTVGGIVATFGPFSTRVW